MTANKRFILKPYDGLHCEVYDKDVEIAEVHRDDAKGLVGLLNELHEENQGYKRIISILKSLLLEKVEELKDDYERSVKAGMPTGAIIGELDSFEEICRIMEWIE